MTHPSRPTTTKSRRYAEMARSWGRSRVSQLRIAGHWPLRSRLAARDAAATWDPHEQGAVRDEIDGSLSGNAERRRPPSSYLTTVATTSPYNFRRPDRVSKEQIHLLQFRERVCEKTS